MSIHWSLKLLAIQWLGSRHYETWMSFSINWGLIARMDGILSAKPFNVLYKQPQFYSVSKYWYTEHWSNTWHMYHDHHNFYKGGDTIIMISACTSTRDRGQDLDPSNFHAWPLDRTENLALTLDYWALTTPIDRLERLWPFLSCPRFLAWPWPLDSDRLTSFKISPWPLDLTLTPVAGGSTVVYVVSPSPPCLIALSGVQMSVSSWIQILFRPMHS